MLMKAEKIQKEQTPRTIQTMRKGGGTAQFADNRNAVQLTSSEEEEESMQLKKDSAIQRKPNNTGLPDNLKTGVENLSGLSMDDVRVYYNSPKPATVQALAYTQGTDIHVAPGQEQHLPHETWHVVQQMQGRVQPTTEVGGMPVNNDVGLEREADVMGKRITQFKEVNTPKTYTSIPSSVAQFITEEEIKKRAYEIYENRKRTSKSGDEKQDWYEAETELKMIESISSVNKGKNTDKREKIHLSYESLPIEEFLTLSKNSIKIMLRCLGCDDDTILRKLDSIEMRVIDKEEFAYRSCLYSNFNFLEGNNKTSLQGLFDTLLTFNVENNKDMITSELGIDNDTIIKEYGDTIAQAMGSNTIVFNRGVELAGGVHTIVHEIMHLLANKEAVNKLQTGYITQSDANLGDESVNEYFARISSFNIDSQKASWNASPSDYHDQTFYGKLIEKSQNLKEIDSIDKVRKLAKAYFLGENLDYIVKDQKLV